jgi:hypothetical protein
MYRWYCTSDDNFFLSALQNCPFILALLSVLDPVCTFLAKQVFVFLTWCSGMLPHAACFFVTALVLFGILYFEFHRHNLVLFAPVCLQFLTQNALYMKSRLFNMAQCRHNNVFICRTLLIPPNCKRAQRNFPVHYLPPSARVHTDDNADYQFISVCENFRCAWNRAWITFKTWWLRQSR